MSKFKVAVGRFEKPLESVRDVVEQVGGLDDLKPDAKVFIKPNIVVWIKDVVFPKWGVITTSRVVEDIVVLLKERGVSDITIGEGMVSLRQKDAAANAADAFERLGYNKLRDRYGVKAINIYEREFREVDLGDGNKLNFNADALDSDFIVNLPVLKTHAQAVMTGGIKNLKGLIDLPSRKLCHAADEVKNLDHMIARLADGMPESLTLFDGIYTAEFGPSYDGRAHFSNLLIASRDVLSADMAAAQLLGYESEAVPHLVHAARNRNRPADYSDVETVGEKIEDLASLHKYTFPYNEDGSLPAAMVKGGISGLAYYKYDNSMCTYCSAMTGATITAIAMAFKGEPFPNVEVLTGKRMQPRPGWDKTILFGKCMYELHGDNPEIKEMIPIKGCPPQPILINKALHQAGLMVDPAILENLDQAPAFFLKKYESKPEFEESYYAIS